MHSSEPITSALTEPVESGTSQSLGRPRLISSIWSSVWPLLVFVLALSPAAAIWWWAITRLLALMHGSD